jgi:CubicO group peptidase (beta-lactamase class C family)
VQAVFIRNFHDEGEVSASLSISIEGETVVDLVGGLADPETGRPWTNDTLVVVFSCTKAATALAAHLPADRELLDLDAPVADIWPEFASAGKASATTRMMLDHTVGLPALRERLKPDCLLDWTYMTDRLAAEAPFWEPGTRSGYHALTYGYLVGKSCVWPQVIPWAHTSKKRLRSPWAWTFGLACPRLKSRVWRRRRCDQCPWPRRAFCFNGQRHG